MKISVNTLTNVSKMGKNVNTLTKKSQVTIFMLIGLVILIVFGLVYYLISLQSELKAQEATIKITIDALKSDNIQNFVSNCLEDSLSDGLLLLGNQGGYIFKEQPYSILESNPQSVIYKNNKVAFAITPLLSIPPIYPCNTADCHFKNSPETNGYYFGLRTLFPPLYKSQERSVVSIQRQLEFFVTNKTSNCTNFTELISIPEFSNYEIIEEPIITEIVFADNDVTAIVDYPITIKPYNQEPVKQLLRFFAKVPVRFRSMYFASKDMVEFDNRDLNYLMLYNTSTGFYQRELNYNDLLPFVSLDQDFVDQHNVFVINDSASSIKDQDYFIFQFARHNRAPVLDYVDKQVINISASTLTYSLPVVASDPDESALSFSFADWSNIRFSQPLIKGSQSFSTASIDIVFENVGQHNITLHANDGFVNDWQTVELQICDDVRNVGVLPNTCIAECGASLECDNVPIGFASDCSVNQVRKAECNQSCSFILSDTCGCQATSDCVDKPAFSIIPSGWCSGEEGCNNICTDSIVALFSTGDTTFFQSPLNNSFVCGCLGGAGKIPENRAFLDCDSNNNLNFNGLCREGVCVGDD